MNRILFLWLLLAVALFDTGCERDQPLVSPSRQVVQLQVPSHFPRPEIPKDNPLTQAKIDLGKRLFFDPTLSADRTISCASCHLPELAFSDPRPNSIGVGGIEGTLPEQRRNAPALFNLVYHRNFFWDGNKPTLETQALMPIENPVEMATSIDTVVQRLRRDPAYVQAFRHAFGDSIRPLNILQAIASFERTLISSGSKYDRFIASGMDSTVFNEAEWRGYQLFFLESATNNHAECFHCHGGYNFDDPEGRFRNNGLYTFYQDFGRFNITGDPLDVGKFKVPSLRNIEYTAPYMHDGSMRTLEEVLRHYAKGGNIHPNRDILISNITLTEQDQADIIAFLKTLSDPGFISNPAFRPE
ncbi:MAG: cytochrome-c peroxidase [Bacteroidia bacterium]